MKILWIVNTIIPEIAEAQNKRGANIAGWISGALHFLKNVEDVELSIAYVDDKRAADENGIGDGFTYFNIPYNVNILHPSTRVELRVKEIIGVVNPELIHIWGTECTHTYSVMKVCRELGIDDKVVISIQGLVSYYYHHYLANLPVKIATGNTFKELLKRKNLIGCANDYKERGRYEEIAIQMAKHVIGRTEWDYGCVKRLNPDINYYFCNESLRDPFYNKVWSYDKCEKHTIFVSQSHVPLKGLHFVLQAVANLIKKYPDIKITVTGKNRFNKDLQSVIRFSSYDRYLSYLIKKLDLASHIEFLGTLNAQQMCEAFLKANLFVCSSSIENSPNSLGEAMLLGVPCITSDVGGIRSIFDDKKDGYMYPYDEYYMLEYYIDRIFQSREICEKFSESARKHALKTHDREVNNNTLVKIYRRIVDENSNAK